MGRHEPYFCRWQYRENIRRSPCCLINPGKVPGIRENLVHFPGKNSENCGRINIFEGKVP